MQFYVTLGARDIELSHAFYDRVLATIGWSAHSSFEGWRGYSAGGRENAPTVWICPPFNGEAPSVGNGVMAGFPAASTQEVDAFYREAMAGGATCEGPAGPRPQYGDRWYSAYVRDPTGNKIAVVFNG